MNSSSRTRWVLRTRRPSARRSRSRTLWTLASAAPLLVCVLAVTILSTSAPRASHPVTVATTPTIATAEQLAAAAAQLPASQKKSTRIVYQYSVVPGGVQSVSELAAAVAHDPDVALHYSRLNFRRAHVVRLTQNEKFYISYRRHGRILWTKTPHLIRAGEEVITDGKITARKRCGNRLSAKPKGIIAPDEPSEAQLNQPMAMAGDPARPPAILLAQNKSALMPPLVANGPVGPGSGGIPYIIGPPIGGGGGVACETQAQLDKDHHKNVPVCPTKPHKPPPSVPEPSTYVLVGSGMLLLAYQYVSKCRSAPVN